MKSIADYVLKSEKEQICRRCDDLICSRHCAVWRKAEERRDADDRQREVHGSCEGIGHENL